MKLFSLTTLLALTLTVSARAADSTVTLSHVHLCCKSCVTGVEKATSKVTGATAQVDKDGGTITITAADHATVQKAVDAVVGAGYFGSSSDASIKLKSAPAKDGKVQSLTLAGVHLCCGKCVTAVNNALSSVSGVKSNTAEKGAKSFAVTGDFSPKEVFAALNKAGLSGKAGK